MSLTIKKEKITNKWKNCKTEMKDQISKIRSNLIVIASQSHDLRLSNILDDRHKKSRLPNS